MENFTFVITGQIARTKVIEVQSLDSVFSPVSMRFFEKSVADFGKDWKEFKDEFVAFMTDKINESCPQTEEFQNTSERMKQWILCEAITIANNNGKHELRNRLIEVEC